MAESIQGLKRTMRCGEVKESDIGREVTLMGWVQKRRNLGSLIFVDLRDRSGLMQIWRMNRDGTEQTQMTCNERNNWFGHISPDGRKVVYLSYRKGELEPREHLPNMRVELWMMNADGSEKHRLISFFGGQGSINVNSWAGDSRHLAFVSYEILH